MDLVLNNPPKIFVCVADSKGTAVLPQCFTPGTEFQPPVNRQDDKESSLWKQGVTQGADNRVINITHRVPTVSDQYYEEAGHARGIN